MPKYRSKLPQLSGDLFITDGGIETTLIYHEGFELPLFAAFDLLKTPKGQGGLRKYFDTYASIANRLRVGCILESATWRASSDWAERLGYTPEKLTEVNRHAIRMLEEIREAHETPDSPMVISGCIGPRGDGYNPESFMKTGEAERYHSGQAKIFRETEADMITAITMTYANEAVGLTRAAKAEGMPVVISFTLETDGRLPSGQPLREAIEEVDDATESAPAYYMINCAHPTHFQQVLEPRAAWVERLRGLRANASKRSHAELDAATELDEGNPAELGREYVELRSLMTKLNVLGGCCGTDDRHVEAACKAVLAAD